MTADAAPQKRSGLSVVWDVVVAPKSAFESLRARPQWLWAFLAVCVLGMIGAFLQVPAGQHIAVATIQRQAAHDPSMASLTPAELQRSIQIAQTVQKFVWLFYPIIAIIGILVAAVVLLIGNAIARGTGNFGRLFALATNVAVINFGLGYLVIGALSALRGPEEFSSQTDLIKLVPSLSWLVPGAEPKVVALLNAFNPFQIWSFILLALGLGTIAELKPVPAYVIAALVSFGAVVFVVPFVK